MADDAHFMLSGGDSLQAMRLFDYLTVSTETASAGLLEVILDGSFSDVLKHLASSCQATSGKRRAEDSASVVAYKRYHTEVDSNSKPEGVLSPVVSSERNNTGFVVVRRAADVVFRDCFLNRQQRLAKDAKAEDDNMDWIEKNDPSAELASKPDLTAANSSSGRPTDFVHVNRDIPSSSEQIQNSNTRHDVPSQPAVPNDSQPLDLQVCWSSDTGRCVDASPVLLIAPERAIVFIGSHSHRLQALNLSNGEVVWERVLGGRLESSAAVSKCGTLVALGLYLEICSGKCKAW